jgi:hypothetical protein
MHACLYALERYLHEPSDIPPLLRVALVHYQFEAIHPFLDGNGRVGRLLVSLLLLEWGLLPKPLLYLSAYFEANRSEYYDRLLAVTTDGDWRGWATFFLAGVARESADVIERAKRLQALRGVHTAAGPGHPRCCRASITFSQPAIRIAMARSPRCHVPGGVQNVETGRRGHPAESSVRHATECSSRTRSWVCWRPRAGARR